MICLESSDMFRVGVEYIDWYEYNSSCSGILSHIFVSLKWFDKFIVNWYGWCRAWGFWINWVIEKISYFDNIRVVNRVERKILIYIKILILS